MAVSKYLIPKLISLGAVCLEATVHYSNCTHYFFFLLLLLIGNIMIKLPLIVIIVYAFTESELPLRGDFGPPQQQT